MSCFSRLLLGLVMCAACGSVKNGQLPDAPDPGSDAAVDAPARGTVKVTVLDPSGTGAPAVGANVVFLDPDGTLVKRAATDTAGRAEADVLPGASVTSIVLNNTSYQMQTVIAIEPGDDLVLGIKNADSAEAGTFTISYPAFTGATSYAIATPCSTPFFAAPASGAPPPPATVTMFNSCKLSPMELVVIPHDANGPMASIAKANVPYVNGGSTTITGNYQSLRRVTVSYSNIDPVITALSMSRSIPDAFGFSNNESADMPATTAVMNFSGPQGMGGQILTSVSNANGSQGGVRQLVSGSAATYGLDVGATLLPWLSVPTYNAAAGKLVVPLDTTGTSTAKPDLFRVTARYQRTDANEVTTTFTWTLFAPEAADIVLPALPADLGINPTASDNVIVNSAIMFEADSVASYKAIRNDVGEALQQYGSSRPPGGTVRFSLALTRR
jgi:hypothetical protein